VLDGRDAVAISPSTLPVLKKNGTALAGSLQTRRTATVTMDNARRLIANLHPSSNRWNTGELRAWKVTPERSFLRDGFVELR
jgi:hypothetical protein